MAAGEIYMKNGTGGFWWRDSGDVERVLLGTDLGVSALPKGEIYITANTFYYVDGEQRLRHITGTVVSTAETAGTIYIGAANGQFYYRGTSNLYRIPYV